MNIDDYFYYDENGIRKISLDSARQLQDDLLTLLSPFFGRVLNAQWDKETIDRKTLTLFGHDNGLIINVDICIPFPEMTFYKVRDSQYSDDVSVLLEFRDFDKMLVYLKNPRLEK